MLVATSSRCRLRFLPVVKNKTSQIVGHSDVVDFLMIFVTEPVWSWFLLRWWLFQSLEFVTNIWNLSPTQTVINIRHQNWCSLSAVKMKVHEIDLIYSKCPRNSEIRSILAQSEIGFTKLINVGLFDFSCKVKCQKDLLNIFNFRQHPSDKFHYVIQILIIQKSPT